MTAIKLDDRAFLLGMKKAAASVRRAVRSLETFAREVSKAAAVVNRFGRAAESLRHTPTRKRKGGLNADQRPEAKMRTVPLPWANECYLKLAGRWPERLAVSDMRPSRH